MLCNYSIKSLFNIHFLFIQLSNYTATFIQLSIVWRPLSNIYFFVAKFAVDVFWMLTFIFRKHFIASNLFKCTIMSSNALVYLITLCLSFSLSWHFSILSHQLSMQWLVHNFTTILLTPWLKYLSFYSLFHTLTVHPLKAYFQPIFSWFVKCLSSSFNNHIVKLFLIIDTVFS